jgi:ubiquinone/menaquinone biosynthesis C-methylase UbiE
MTDRDWRAYDSVATTYARVHAPHFALPAGDLVDLLGVREGDRVLDVGAGTGVAARAAAAVVGVSGLVVGIDPSSTMLVEARREGGGPRYAMAMAIDLPFRDRTFDHATANFVMSHFKKYDTALFDMLRVLQRGGRIGVSNWGAGHDRDEFSATWRGVTEEFADRRILSDAMQRAVPWEERFSDPRRLEEALYDAGVRDIRVERREYRFEMTAEDYLAGREIASQGRFLREMLGEGLWERFRARARDVFADRFPPRFNDFRDVILAVGTKPKA